MKFLVFYGTPRFFTVFTRLRHWSLSWSTASHPVYRRSILIFSSHLRLDLPSHLFQLGSPNKIFYTFLISHAYNIPALLVLLDFITLTIFSEVYKLQISSLCSLLQPLATSFLVGPNILLSTLFSNALNLFSSLIVRDPVLYPYKTTDRILWTEW